MMRFVRVLKRSAYYKGHYLDVAVWRKDAPIRAPSHLTAAQIKHALKALLARTVDDPVTLVKSTHPQRIKREMLKRGACKFHGVLMLESTEATRFILSHVSEDIQGTDTANTATTSQNGDKCQ